MTLEEALAASPWHEARRPYYPPGPEGMGRGDIAKYIHALRGGFVLCWPSGKLIGSLHGADLEKTQNQDDWEAFWSSSPEKF